MPIDILATEHLLTIIFLYRMQSGSKVILSYVTERYFDDTAVGQEQKQIISLSIIEDVDK